MNDPQKGDGNRASNPFAAFVRELRLHRKAVGGYIATSVAVVAVLVALDWPGELLIVAALVIYVVVPFILVMVHDDEEDTKPSATRDLANAMLLRLRRLATRRRAIVAGVGLLGIVLVVRLWLAPGSDEGDPRRWPSSRSV